MSVRPPPKTAYGDQRPVILNDMQARGRRDGIEQDARKIIDFLCKITDRYELWVPVVPVSVPHPASFLCIASVPPCLQIADRSKVFFK